MFGKSESYLGLWLNFPVLTQNSHKPSLSWNESHAVVHYALEECGG